MQSVGPSDPCQSPASGAAHVLVGQVEVGAKERGSCHGLAKQWRRHETRNLCHLAGSLSLSTAMSTDY